MDFSFLGDSLVWAGFYLGVGSVVGYLTGVWRERRRHHRLYHLPHHRKASTP